MTTFMWLPEKANCLSFQLKTKTHEVGSALRCAARRAPSVRHG